MRIADQLADPLAAGPARPTGRGRGAPAHQQSTPVHFRNSESRLQPRGLGFAADRPPVVTPRHLQGRELLKPVAFVRGADQPLLIDPDGALHAC